MTADGKTNTQNDKSEAEASQNEEPVIKEDEKWLIRDCDTYYDEYKECTSFRGRFQQYFVYGESVDCNQWKKDYDNCYKWESNGDCKAGLALINSEKQRRLHRLRAHYRNDIWKKRDAPPADWDKPLPDWMVKRDEHTYLAEKAKEMKEGKIEEVKSSCCIM